MVIMIGRDEASNLQKAALMVAGVIGLACCLAALLDMRSQQADEEMPARTKVETLAGAHHMRGWLVHGSLSKHAA